MVSLDQKTLLVVFVAITLMMGILMLHFAKNNPTIGGPLFWSLGSFSIGLGSFFFVFLSDLVIVKVISSSAIVLGVSLYLAGVRSFNRKKINYWIILGIPLFELIQGAIFFLVYPLPYMRMAFYFLSNALLAALIMREFSRPASKSLKRIYWLGLALFSIYALSSLSRVVFAFFIQDVLVMEQERVNVVLFFLFCLTQPLVMFTFVLMITSELTDRLNEKIEGQQKIYSIISHDIIGPVGSISQMLSLINKPENVNEEERVYLLNELEEASHLTHHLIKNLLLWSRSQMNKISPTIQDFDLNKIVLQNVELQRYVSKLKGVSILYAENPDLKCRADEQMVDTVIRNLISNSIKFSRPQSEIVVTCENTGPNVQIKISDSGVGMSEATLNNLFVNQDLAIKTGTSGEKGTGLGLMLCKNFVEDNFGSLKVFSRENIGTEVLVTLPVC